MYAVLKIMATLAVVVFLLNRKVKMGNAMLAGSGVLLLLSGLQLSQLQAAVWETVATPSTWEIILALYFVMCLEYQLRCGGIIDGLMSAARKVMRSDRILLALMPAFLGFLPSLGGAIFSAPLVENAGKPYKLTGETKTAINYWFRHVWEFTNPILASMLLASQLAGIPLNTLILSMVWVTVLATLIGWLFFLTPLKGDSQSEQSDSADADTDTGYRYLILAAGPILANFFLVVVMKLSASLAMALVVAAMAFILRQNVSENKAMLSHAFDRKLLWGIVAILFFQNILRQTGAIEDIAALLNNLAVSNAVIIGAIAFAAGILTGSSQGFIALTFPFVAVLAPGDVALATLAFVVGVAGQMLSPAHLCLLVTLDYFKADFLKTLRPIAFLEIIMVGAAWIAVKMPSLFM
ncbi:MAG: integral rane protein [Firmicutes bacterium]|nr:integral rane protein [Bacillota bacterium]